MSLDSSEGKGKITFKGLGLARKDHGCRGLNENHDKMPKI